jgi:hypothetical protein
MKRAFRVIGLIALWLAAAAVLCPAQTQVGNYGIRYQFSSPVSTPCGTNAPMTVLQPVGDIFTCQNGVYALAGGGGGGMVFPPVGIGVSTGSAWSLSINPSTLATWPPAGVPVSTGTAWGTSIDPTTLAAWPQVMLCGATPCTFSYLPAFNNSPTSPGWSPPTTTLNAGLWLQSPWPSGVALVAAQGPVLGTPVASIYSTGINPFNVAVLSPSGAQLFVPFPVSTNPVGFPNSPQVTPGATNDLNTAAWCGLWGLSNTPFPANLPPNVATNNPTSNIPMIVSCTGGGVVGATSGHAQIVFDSKANLVWYRNNYSNGWNQWVSLGPLAPFTVATLPTCNTAAQGVTFGVTDATAPTYLGTLTGGGAVYAPAVCNGTAWVSY